MPGLKIGIDAMGGDFAPVECIRGAALVLDQLPPDAQLVLYGDLSQIQPLVHRERMPSHRVELVHCEEVVGMAESPTRAMQQKPNSSIAIGFQHLKEGFIDAFAGAGNTGAMMVGAVQSVRTIEGVLRPSLTTVVPRDNDHLGILLDVGANVDCRPEMLLQFGLLGSLYAQYVYHIDAPRVALISIGEEEGKGNQLVKEAAELMRASRQLRFIGNIEGRHIFSNQADVMVCDGFVGNIILKFGESIYDMVKRRGITDPYWDRFNYENYGGSGILGLNAPVVVAHGISNANAFRNMILLTREMVESRLVERFREAFLNLQTAELG
ncbi:MAG: phosphate acyltransferase PlsX [Chitinophagales bacterium]|nr:phosphate acyltransferase PlsX [Chitinophagales bacterium]MDW8393611.1 phosphate acyltransferase PlsX [Chitinophagales bacterium]